MSNPILKSALAALHDDYTITIHGEGESIETVIAPWLIARTAECAQPDGHEREGAAFLTSTFASFACAIENDLDVADDAEADDLRDALESFDWHEYADNAVPVYTHKKWLTFVHLAAYEEDVADYINGARTGDSDIVANVALYQIADRLFRALAKKLADKCEDSEHWTNHAAEIDAAEEQ